MPADSFGAAGPLTAGGGTYRIFRVNTTDGAALLPYCLKVLLENLLRNEDGHLVTAAQIEALAGWDPAAEPSAEIAFTPARVLLQDFTGVPCLVDLAAMREAMAALGGDPARVNPLRPAELVIDHSVIADFFGRPDALARNIDLEFQRNAERYAFLRWGQQALPGLRVVPPGTGICHQVNLEHLARVVFAEDGTAYPDTLVGTDSHTPMVNGLGVLGWGVGGIEAEAAMLGQPLSMLIPQVIGVRLSGQLPEGATATDLVLTIAELLRSVGVVGTFVEFFGPGVAARAGGRPGHDRQHEPGVRVHQRDLPRRRGDPGLPAAHRPPGGAGGAGRGLRQGAGAVARPGPCPGLLAGPGPGPGGGGPVDRRAEAAAGPHPAGPGAAGVPRGTRPVRPGRAGPAGLDAAGADPSPPPTRSRSPGTGTVTSRPASSRSAAGRGGRATRSRSPSAPGRRWNWTTGRW